MRQDKNRPKLLPLWIYLISLGGAAALLVLFSQGMRTPGAGAALQELPANTGAEAREIPEKLHVLPPLREFVGFMEGELQSNGTVGAACTVVLGG